MGSGRIVTPHQRRRMRLEDPAYVADSPHDFWVAIQHGERYRATRTAAELEGWLREAPAPAELLELDILRRERYDGTGQLLGLWCLQHLERWPEDAQLPDVVKRELLKAHPEIGRVGFSTAQWVWAWAAAQRVFDAHVEG